MVVTPLWHLALALLWHLALAVVDKPRVIEKTTTLGIREVTARWAPSSADGFELPTGYLFSIWRCTGVANTDAGRCASGYWLREGSLDTTFLSADAACNSDSSSCHTVFHLERGWKARFRIYSLDANNQSSADAGELFPAMDTSPPDQIVTLENTTVPGDGRHRSFTWRSITPGCAHQAPT